MAALCKFHIGSHFHIQFRAQRKVRITQKKLQIEVVRNCSLYKKVCEGICLFLARVELGALKDWYSLNMILYWNGKIHSIEGSMLHKTMHHTKKSFKYKLFGIELRTKKFTSAYVYFPQSGARGFEKLKQMKYYTVLKWQITFNLGLNGDKNNDNGKKLSK